MTPTPETNPMRLSDTNPLNAQATPQIPLTKMGFGGAALANMYTDVPEADALGALQRSYDHGVRYFDTAPFYGLGLSETRFASAMRRFGRENIQLSTKVGRVVTGEGDARSFHYDYSYDGVMRSYEASLTRLDVDRVDILLVHDLCRFTHGSQEASDARVAEFFDQGGYRAMRALRDSGAVGAIGAGVNEWQVCERLLSMGDFDGFLLAGRYTLLEQDALDSFLPLCQQRDVGIILGGPYNSGILATGAVEGAKYNYTDAPADIMDRVSRIEAVCAAHNTPLIAAALQFVLGHPAVKTVVPGARSVAEVDANAALMERDIPTALWSDLKAEKLIRADAPTP